MTEALLKHLSNVYRERSSILQYGFSVALGPPNALIPAYPIVYGVGYEHPRRGMRRHLVQRL